MDKESLATGRWLIQQLQSVTKSASQDEAEINELRWKGDALANEEDAQEDDPEVKSKFSLVVLPKKSDLE
ncbi:hypothetical protein D3C85_1532530 [compost metagenome]